MGGEGAGLGGAETRVQLCDVLDLPGRDPSSRRPRREGEGLPFRRHVACNVHKQELFLREFLKKPELGNEEIVFVDMEPGTEARDGLASRSVPDPDGSGSRDGRTH